jgi:hypothetical protein
MYVPLAWKLQFLCAASIGIYILTIGTKLLVIVVAVRQTIVNIVVQKLPTKLIKS